MPFVPRNLIKEEIQVLHDRVVVYQNLKTVVLKTKVYTATRPATDSQKGGLRPLSVRLQELLTVWTGFQDAGRS